MKTLIPFAVGTVLLLASASPLTATDPPHNEVRFIDCAWCHTPHASPGGALTAIAGNANLCQSCHQSTGPAFALNDADQALPFPGLPAGTPASGDSHRWDSGPAGHVEPVGANASTGTVASGGAFTGRYAKTYTLTITTAGNAGSAIFAWTDTQGGSVGGLLSGTGVPLDEGVNVSFTDGTGSPSFLLNDQWRIFVRTDINAPTDPEMVPRFADGKITCSTCHNQHSQLLQPFDPLSPPYSGPGTGWLRHYMRVDNDTNQLCVECHAARDVADSSLGSHPVGVAVPGAGDFKPPATLPLDAAGDVACQSCHRAHRGATNDGTVVRLANANTMCSDCHTLADTATPASHLHASTGVLWPGGQYGSSFPAITDTGKRGFCINCHTTHGWPDDASPAQDYEKLLVERSADLCITCHDGNPASNELADFASTLFVNDPVGDADNLNLNTRHDVKESDQAVSGTDLACSDCHDPHTATPTAKLRPDPDPSDSRVPAAGLSWGGSSFESEWCLDCHDGSFPAGVTPPATALVDIRNEYLTHDDHGTTNGNADLKAGYGWADDDIVPCTACHVAGHGSTNLFQLRTTIYSKDGLTPIPSDCGGTTVAVTDNNIGDTAINGWCFCNTCHDDSMGDNRDDCFKSGCHTHGDRM